EIVALSFFATAPDHCDGAFFEVKSARAKVEAIQGHPRLHRMQDILGCEYALILLTQAEFDGPLCQPPGSQIETDRKPNWMTLGAAASHWKMIGLDETVQDNYLKRILGEKPPRDVMYNRAIRWIPRKSDLNAGVPPREDWENDNSAISRIFTGPRIRWRSQPTPRKDANACKTHFGYTIGRRTIKTRISAARCGRRRTSPRSAHTTSNLMSISAGTILAEAMHNSISAT
nr:hypothetical protein [Agrobacterium sp. rho-8.1]